jgi:hypothetical protein
MEFYVHYSVFFYTATYTDRIQARDNKMITANIIQRILHIQFRKQTGTAFVADIEDKQYIITAKHIIEGMPPPRYY